MSPTKDAGGLLAGVPGGAPAVALFGASILAYVAQTELASYVQVTRHYHKSYFMLYLAHCTFLLTFPCHLLLLRLFSPTSTPLRPALAQLASVWHVQLTGEERQTGVTWPWRKTFVFVAGMSLLITCPSLLWYCAVPFTSMTSITSIYNTSALFAYVFSVLLLSDTWDSRKLLAVVLATLGVGIVAYGGASGSSSTPTQEKEETYEWSLIGDGMALLAAGSYGFYEVIYKKHYSLATQPSATLPFGFHSSLLTSLIGLFTLTCLAIPIPILHYTGLEPFALPDSPGLAACVGGVAVLGVVFNGSFMCLLGIWGPVVASVGNLLTILGVGVADSLVDDEHPLTPMILLGGGLVCGAFALMVYDMVQEEKKERREGRGTVRKLEEEGAEADERERLTGPEDGDGDGQTGEGRV